MKKGLGRGLDALFDGYANDGARGEGKRDISEINIIDIDPNPHQPRKRFSEDKIDELSKSIKHHGVVQPIALKKQGNRYIIVAGERRWRAAREAGLTTIPAVIMDLTDKEVIEIALVENLQRENLNPIEEAEGIKMLIDQYKLTQEEVATRLGRSRPAIANSLRLLNLTETLKNHLIQESLTPGHARALLGIADLELREKLAATIIEKDMNVRDTERLIKKMVGSTGKKDSKIPEKPIYLTEIEMNLEEALGTRVIIKPGKKKGIIEIEYYNDDDLERIMEKVYMKD
ncbi:MAG TPA: ParB/RepB/Spo0J family partition protein, partial [Bacillota bacterium]|nr:ParB/RepB/Spo0J family partition protein [Bacillota bacterium]